MPDNYFDKYDSAPAAPTGVTAQPSEAPNEGLSTAEKIGAGVLGGGAAALLAAKFPALRESLANLAARAKISAAEIPLWKQAGLRTAESSPVARNLAGTSGQEALRLHTADVSRTVGANEAGIPAAQAPLLSHDILIDARREPNSVYDRVETAVPPGALNPKAQQAVLQAGLPEKGRMSQGSPQAQAQIEQLRAQLLDPARQFTGAQFVNEMRGLRQEGFTNIASDDVSNQQLGRAQLSMARAVEGHILDSLPKDGPVTPDQFLAARKTLAKNFTVQSALRGNDLDLKALARVQRSDPELLDGGLKMLADFAETHPEVAALPAESTRYNPPSFARDIENISLKNPVSWVRPALGSLARRSLVGDPDAAIAAANQMFPARPGGRFAAPTPPPASPFGGYLPSPDMVNAGGGATTPSTLESLGLTPDVQAAGAQHPAAARLQALKEALSRPPMETVEFQGPQNWGPPGVETKPPFRETNPALGETIPYAEVLEQGGTQRPPIGAPGVTYRPPAKSPAQPKMRTPPGAPELTEYAPYVPSEAQMNFRNQQAADRLRKVAGDLSVEGPGGATGDPLERLRAALLRRERGYAEGGTVVSFAKKGAETLMNRIEDAFHNPYTADWNQLRQDISKYWTTAAPAATTTAEATAAAAPPATIAAPKEESLEDITRSLHELLTPGASEQQFAGGGRVELMAKIGELLDHLAAEHAARNADVAARFPERPRLPLQQLADDPRMEAALAPPADIAAPAPMENPLQPGFLTRRQAMADGGSVDDTQSSIRRVADAARALNPYSAPQGTEDRARIATNLASLLYGLDAQGRPALGGRAWTPSQGGTPAGALDALTALPHNMVQLAAMADKYLPGKSNPQFWASVDPSWSKAASDRLTQLRARLQQAAGVAPAKSLEEQGLDIVTDPALLAPVGAAKVAGEGSALRRALNWGAGGTEDPTHAAQ